MKSQAHKLWENFVFFKWKSHCETLIFAKKPQHYYSFQMEGPVYNLWWMYWSKFYWLDSGFGGCLRYLMIFFFYPFLEWRFFVTSFFAHTWMFNKIIACLKSFISRLLYLTHSSNAEGLVSAKEWQTESPFNVLGQLRICVIWIKCLIRNDYNTAQQLLSGAL